MRAYCTLFDKNYLLQGVALYNSLERVSKEFKFYALCIDPKAFDVLTKAKLRCLVPINVEELLTPEVLRVRERTTYGQFCWVCQPLICQFILDKFQEDMVTYLEADSLFFSDPEVLFEELGEGSVSLVPHNFSSQFEYYANNSGKFCVQFNAFKNNLAARAVLDYWKEGCFKYNKKDTAYLPGQICLNDWPERFPCVRVIRHPGAGVAPWNIQRFQFRMVNSAPQVDGFPVVFYHFHAYGRYKNGDHELGRYPLTKGVIESVYGAYVGAIRGAEMMARAIDPDFIYRKEYENPVTIKGLFQSFTSARLHQYCRELKRKVSRTYNVVPDGFFTKVLERSRV